MILEYDPFPTVEHFELAIANEKPNISRWVPTSSNETLHLEAVATPNDHRNRPSE